MQRRPFLTVSLFAFAALAAGCSHPNPLVGTWQGTYMTPRGAIFNT